MQGEAAASLIPLPRLLNIHPIGKEGKRDIFDIQGVVGIPSLFPFHEPRLFLAAGF